MHQVVFYLATFLPGLAVLGLFIASSRKQRSSFDSLAAPPMERFASLQSVAASRGRSWWFGLLSTILPLAGTAALLAIRWQTIPERFPTHWRIDGQPNRWTNRTPASTFGFLAFALLLTLLFGLMGELIARSSPGHKGRTEAIAATQTILVVVAWFITLLFCAVSLLPLTRDPTNLVPFIAMISTLVSLALIGYIVYRSLRMTDILASAQSSTEARFWKGGVVYFNPADSALMVPKRQGSGYTMNFGRPLSWLILSAILALPFIIPLVMHASGRH